MNYHSKENIEVKWVINNAKQAKMKYINKNIALSKIMTTAPLQGFIKFQKL